MKKAVSIHKLMILLIFLFLYLEKIEAQEQKEFASIYQILDFAKIKNHQFRNAESQTKLAELTAKTAIVNVFNPKIPTSVQVLNNINQQVSFLPGQVFGLPVGTFKEVIIGQNYVSTFSIQPQFDIFNLSNYAQLKTAKTNLLLVENQNKINEQNLYEKISMVYFNTISFHAQKRIIKENITIAKDVLRIIQNRFNEGIVRKQEVNEAEVNLISLQDKLEQLELNIDIQNQTLNVLLENQVLATLSEDLWNYEKTNGILSTQNKLLTDSAKFQSQIAQQEYQALKYQNLPVLSFISSFNWQNLSNDFSFAKNSSWIDFSYVGLKLAYDLPTTIQKYTNLKSKKLQIEVAKNDEEYSQIENENRNRLMVLEYEKALKQKENLSAIFNLKTDTYQKNFNQFKENILPLDKLLLSQNDMLMSKLNIVFALTNIGFYKTKIEINNQ